MIYKDTKTNLMIYSFLLYFVSNDYFIISIYFSITIKMLLAYIGLRTSIC